MRGKSVTLETIGQTVTDGFEKVSNNVNDYISSDKPRSFFQKIADLFVTVFGFLLKFGAVLVGIILLPPLLLVVFILFVVTVALIGGGAGMLYQLSPFGMDLYSGVPVYMAVLGCIGIILPVSYTHLDVYKRQYQCYSYCIGNSQSYANYRNDGRSGRDGSFLMQKI